MRDSRLAESFLRSIVLFTVPRKPALLWPCRWFADNIQMELVTQRKNDIHPEHEVFIIYVSCVYSPGSFYERRGINVARWRSNKYVRTNSWDRQSRQSMVGRIQGLLRFYHMLPLAVARYFLWRQCDTLCTSGFVADVIHVFYTIDRIRAKEIKDDAYASSSSPGGSTWGEICRLRQHLVVQCKFYSAG